MPTASSFTIGAVMTEADVRGIERAISRSQAAAWLKRQLSERVLCNRDHSWVRRQYAPCRYPRFHAPHGWHQDGALGFDFLSHPDGNYPANALLKVATCWIALDRCGVVAPGLELITETLPQLLPPSELAESRLRSRFPVQSFWRPAMQPGDALLFLGDVLHRTHVTPEMNGDRTSIELRFFAAENIPHRLKADRFVPL